MVLLTAVLFALTAIAYLAVLVYVAMYAGGPQLAVALIAVSACAVVVAVLVRRRQR